MAFQYPKK
jgi:hypothetical protein